MLVRLQKFLADAGVASRRAGELIITEGRVSVNGHVIRELGSKVDPSHDRVVVDGTPVKEKRKIYVALNKPPGYICSRSDPEGRRVVVDLLPKEWAGLYPVGRLDYNTEGLLFLTNDGDFSLRLTHPRYGVRKKYLATVEGLVEPMVIRRLTAGVYHKGERLKAERARILKAGGKRSLVELELTEGKNREVRRLFESQDLALERLERVQIGRIKLGELPPGKWRTLSNAEVASLVNPPKPELPARTRPARQH
jgi:23S rRNA pseudouridine2605 synthase